MKMSRMLGMRLKERPAEAVLDSHALLLRGGYMRSAAHGEFVLLPPGKRILEKITQIAFKELETNACAPLEMPSRPETSGRERFLHLSQAVRREMQSSAQLPVALTSLVCALRDEPPVRFGLIRSRLFRVLEVCAFHAEPETRTAFQGQLIDTMLKILRQCGFLGAFAAQAGKYNTMLILPSDAGDAEALRCPACSRTSMTEWAKALIPGDTEEALPLEPVHTPGAQSITQLSAMLGILPQHTAKAVFFQRESDDRLVVALIRGDRDVSEAKLRMLWGKNLHTASPESIREAGGEPGFASPLGMCRSAFELVVDDSMANSSNLLTGANRQDYHLRNFNLKRDLPGEFPVDIALAAPGDRCVCGQGTLESVSGFELGKLLSLPEDCTRGMVMDDGVVPRATIGRLGLDRMMGLIAQQHHDDFGPVWPQTVSPWQVHLLALPGEEVAAAAESLYQRLAQSGIETLYDDRGLRPGVQFAEADLLGIPWRVILGGKSLAQGQAELKSRGSRDAEAVPLDDIPQELLRRV